MSTSVPARPLPRWSAASPFVAIGTACVVALALAEVRGAVRQPAWPLYLYRGLIALLLLSIPVGLIIAAVRPR